MSKEYKERPVTDDEVTSVITELSAADAYGFGDRVSAGQALRRAVDLIERLAEARRPAQAPLADGELARRPTDEEIERWITDCCDATRGGSAKHYWVFDVQRDDVCDIARAALARWGRQPDPIPLSERLPGPDDLRNGKAWYGQEQPFGDQDTWDWCYTTPSYGEESSFTHWLPASVSHLPTRAEG